MSSMVATTCDTISPPRCATSVAPEASSLAREALSAFCCTVLDNSSVAEAVCCSEAACCSVRIDRSPVPAATWVEAPAIASAPLRTL